MWLVQSNSLMAELQGIFKDLERTSGMVSFMHVTYLPCPQERGLEANAVGPTLPC